MILKRGAFWHPSTNELFFLSTHLILVSVPGLTGWVGTVIYGERENFYTCRLTSHSADGGRMDAVGGTERETGDFTKQRRWASSGGARGLRPAAPWGEKGRLGGPGRHLAGAGGSSGPGRQLAGGRARRLRFFGGGASIWDRGVDGEGIFRAWSPGGLDGGGRLGELPVMGAWPDSAGRGRGLDGGVSQDACRRWRSGIDHVMNENGARSWWTLRQAQMWVQCGSACFIKKIYKRNTYLIRYLFNRNMRSRNRVHLSSSLEWPFRILNIYTNKHRHTHMRFLHNLCNCDKIIQAKILLQHTI
jgi:hypothetical protein